MLRYLATLAYAFSAVALGSTVDLSKVNGSIVVDAGRHVGDVSTVNGSVTVGRGARVDEVDTVNGSVRLEERATASHAETVNGAVEIGEQVDVLRSVSTVNGAVTLHRGARVGGTLENVNGRLSVQGAQVGGGIETVNGDILIGSGSRVDGGIHVERTSGWNWKRNTPSVTIESGAVVNGTLRFDRAVDLYVGEGATVGPVEGVPPRRHAIP